MLPLFNRSTLQSDTWKRLSLVFTITLFFGVGALLVLNPGLVGAIDAPLSPSSNLITGIVVDPEGDIPPDGTIVKLFGESGSLRGRANLDQSGNFSLGPVANGNYTLKAIAPDGSKNTDSMPLSISMIGSSLDVMTVTLTNPDIEGFIYEPGGEIRGAGTVNIIQDNRVVQSQYAEDGEIRIGGLPTGTYELIAYPEADTALWQSEPETITVTGTSQEIDLILQDAIFYGQVRDEFGTPIANATVHVNGQSSFTYQQDKTGRQGTFAIGDLPNDTYTLRFEPPRQAGSLMETTLISYTVPPTSTNLGNVILPSATKRLSGVVRDNTGQPVNAATVYAYSARNDRELESTTTDQGRYVLNLGQGAWAITIRPNEFLTDVNWIYTDPPQIVIFDDTTDEETKRQNFEVLTSDAVVSGTVTLPGGGVPPFTVTVGVRNNEGLGHSEMVDPSDGSFSINVPNGPYMLYVRSEDPGYAGPEATRIRVRRNSTYDAGSIELIERDSTISGVVQDESGDGIEGVDIIAWTRDAQGTRTETGPDGSYTLSVVAGDWKIRPGVPDEYPYIYSGEVATATIGSSEAITGQTFILQSANNVVIGQLTLNDAPISTNGFVRASDEEGPVNGAGIDGGSFTLYLPDGEFRLKANLSTDSEYLIGRPTTMTVSGGSSTTVTIPVVERNSTIAGVLWNPRAESVVTDVAAAVIVSNDDARQTTVINEENGTYQIGVNDGLWYLGYRVAPQSGYVALGRSGVIPTEADEQVNIRLPVLPRSSQMAGTVSDPDGNPLANAAVIVEGVSPLLRRVTLRTLSDDTGAFSIDLPYGLYRVRSAYDDAAENGWLNPVDRQVLLPSDSNITDLELAYRATDAAVTGSLSISGTGDMTGTVSIFAYNGEGAATKTTAEMGGTYTLPVESGHTWTIRAFFEEELSFYEARTSVEVTGTTNLDIALDGPITKPGPVSVTFDADEDQELSLADGTTIFIPAGAMPVGEGESVTIHITPIATLPHQNSARLYKYGYAFIAMDENGNQISSNFNQNVLITLSYTDEELERLELDEDRLIPSYYSTTTESWAEPESYVVNTDDNTLSLQIDHFTDYTLLNTAPSYNTFMPSFSVRQ